MKRLEHNRQIEALNSREDEDLFLENLAKWREEAARLRALKLDADTLRLVSIEQAAVAPREPIRPKKSLVVALGVLLGAMLGLMIAIGRIALRGRQRKRSLSALG